MSTLSAPSRSRLEVFERLFASATHDASAVMSRWTGGLISLTFDEVREIAVAEAFTELDLNEQPLTMVVLGLEGELGVRMVLVFDNEDARQLAASLLGRTPADGPEWTELEKSALAETGNILGCAYMNALVRLIGAELVPSPPYFVQDYAASVVQEALLVPAMTSDTVLICQTVFRRKEQELDWRVLFIPTEAMRQAIEGAVAPDHSPASHEVQ